MDNLETSKERTQGNNVDIKKGQIRGKTSRRKKTRKEGRK